MQEYKMLGQLFGEAIFVKKEVPEVVVGHMSRFLVSMINNTDKLREIGKILDSCRRIE